MIHSMAGGSLQNVSYNDYAKVKILTGSSANSIFWYLSTNGLKEGNIVKVTVGPNNIQEEAIVLRIDKNVSSQMSPVPYKRVKNIIKIIK